MGRNGWSGLVVLTVLNSACGATAQYAVGFSRTEERRTTRTRDVRIANLPPDTYVERLEPDGTRTPLKGRSDRVPYEVHETVEVPTSRLPMYVGTGLDVLGVASFGLLVANADDEIRPLMVYGLVYAVAALIADLAFSIDYSMDQKPVVVGYEPAESKPVTYLATIGDDTWRATIDVAVADRVDIDVTMPPAPAPTRIADAEAEAEAEPGGPRLGRMQPPDPIVAQPLPRSEPPPEVDESWYGWQTLPIDVLSVGVLIYGAVRQDFELAAIAGGVHVVAGPTIHMAHGQYEVAGASLGLRLGPAVGAGAVGALAGLLISPLIAAYAADVNIPEVIGLATLYGAGIGFVALSPVVAILDAAALSWKPDEAEPTLQIVPAAGRTDEGRTTFGIAGRF